MKSKLHSIDIKFNGRTWYFHWSFVLILAWMLIINLISAAGPGELIWGFILLIAFFLSILIHEGARTLAGKAFGFRETDLLILPSGCVGGGIDSISNFRVKTLVLIAGPLANLGIAFLLKFFIQPYSAYWNEPANIGVVDAGNFLFQLHLVNLSLAILNLIPVLPTDAGRILRGVLDMRVGSRKSKVLMSGFSKWVALSALVLGAYYLNLLIILFALYILITLRSEDQLRLRIQGHQLSNSPDEMDFFLNRSHFS